MALSDRSPSGSCLLATGISVPDKVVPNSWFEARLGITDEWIRSRVGIRERRYAEPSDVTSDFATRAAQAAMDQAGLSGDDIGLVVVASSVPDMLFPATANFVARNLGIKYACAYDVSAACSGFVFALACADAQLRAGMVRGCSLVIGSEIISPILDMTDRGTAFLFGDGAGAAILAPPGSRSGAGILQSRMTSLNEYTDVLVCNGGGTASRTSSPTGVGNLGYIRMDGKQVYRLAIQASSDNIRHVLDAEGMSIDDISLIVPHQANLHMIESIAKEFAFPMERMSVNIDRYGNTAAASVPIALHEALATHRVETGDAVILVAAGAGFNSGAILLRL